MRQQTGDAAGSEREKENSGEAEGEWFGARVRHGSGGRVEFGWSQGLSRNKGATRSLVERYNTRRATSGSEFRVWSD